jgi:CRP-like cAMP-binding protein
MDDTTGLPDTLRTLLPPQILHDCTTTTWERGAVVFETGRKPAYMHHVDDGEVALQRPSESGHVVVLQRTRQGFVAEASLEAERYHCDAVVLARARITRVPRAALLRALRDDAAFAMRWIAMLNLEVRRLRQQCERLGLGTVQARLLHLLRADGAASGIVLGAGLKALAGELGVSHEALYRCVADLEKRGVLERAGAPLRLRLLATRGGGPVVAASRPRAARARR